MGHSKIDINICSYSSNDGIKGYNIHGATLTEVELDVLTGEKQVPLTAFPRDQID